MVKKNQLNQKNKVEKEIKVLSSEQRLGEDLAYTFKGLYKMHDYLKCQYEILLMSSFVISIIVINDISFFGIESIINKLLSIIGVLIAGYMLFKKQEYEKIQGYALLANDIKNLYDKIEKKYLNNEKIDDSFLILSNDLKSKTDVYNISNKSYKKVKETIHSEMSLEWIYGFEYNKK